MKTLSLKLREDIFKDVEKVIRAIRIPRNAYINQALSFYNKLNRRRFLKRQLYKESRLVREDSLNTLEVFERLDDDIRE
jgi:hypothetical protein